MISAEIIADSISPQGIAKALRAWAMEIPGWGKNGICETEFQLGTTSANALADLLDRVANVLEPPVVMLATDLGCYQPYTCQAGRGDPPMDCIWPDCPCGTLFYIDPPNKLVTCADCNGSGEVGSRPNESPCPNCNGQGCHTITPDTIDIVFDGPPGPVAGRFVEVEDANGKSMSLGEWLQRPDGYWVLRFQRNA